MITKLDNFIYAILNSNVLNSFPFLVFIFTFALVTYRGYQTYHLQVKIMKETVKLLVELKEYIRIQNRKEELKEYIKTQNRREHEH